MQSIRPIAIEDSQATTDAGNDETKETKKINIETSNMIENQVTNIDDGMSGCCVEDGDDDDVVPFIIVNKNQEEEYGKDNNIDCIKSHNDSINNSNNNNDIGSDNACRNTIANQYSDHEKNKRITNNEDEEEEDGGDDDDFGDRLMQVAIANMQEQVGALEKQVCLLACQSARVRVALKDHKLSKYYLFYSIKILFMQLT